MIEGGDRAFVAPAPGAGGVCHDEGVTTTTPSIPGLVPRPKHVELLGAPASADTGAPACESIDVVIADDPADLGIPADVELGDWQRAEAHRIVIRSGRARVTALGPLGELRARRRLAVLLACAPEGAPLPDLALVDYPTYRHRGLSLDVVRHFFGPDTILRVMDLMADLALNVLHLHLSDDQAWRVEIPALPELTAVSGAGAVGGIDATEAAGGRARGFFTLDDLARLEAEARERGISLVPEFDVPGHTNAALHAMPGLNPDRACPPTYEGGEVGFSTLSTAAPDTERFLTEVIATLAAHAELGLHIGGDECFSTSRDEYDAIVSMAAERVRAKGRRVIAWQEAADLLKVGELVQVWDPRLESDAVARATHRGVGLLVSPADHVYLDMKQAADQRIGLDWMGVVPLRQALEWEPTGVVAGAAPERIEGVEACLWAETVVTEADLGQMILPRLSASAEVAWAGSGVGQWESYRERAAALARLWRVRGWEFFADEGIDWVDLSTDPPLTTALSELPRQRRKMR